MKRCLFAAFVLAGCASPLVQTAKTGDRTRLATLIAERHKDGSLSNGEAARIAHEVARREIETANPREAVARLGDLSGCAGEFDRVLEERMGTHDEAGATAAWMRLESRRLTKLAARKYVGDSDDAWRAVGAATLTRKSDRDARRAAMVDPSPRVRRAAMRAAAYAENEGDLDTLFESARLDPEPYVRTEAVRAIRALGEARPRDVAMRLRDLWASGDDAMREDIAVSWSLQPIFKEGGREALRVLLASEHGPGVLAGAGGVLRNHQGDAELKNSAVAVLARTIEHGTHRDRLHALAVAQTEPDLLRQAIEAAAKDVDPTIRIGAWSRLLEVKDRREAAIRELELLAGQRDAGSSPAARAALARAGHMRIQAWVEEDLRAQQPSTRVLAAISLVELGRAGRAAPLLADHDPHVRTQAACVIAKAP